MSFSVGVTDVKKTLSVPTVWFAIITVSLLSASEVVHLF